MLGLGFFVAFLVKLNLIRPNFPKVMKSLVSITSEDTLAFMRAQEPSVYMMALM